MQTLHGRLVSSPRTLGRGLTALVEAIPSQATQQNTTTLWSVYACSRDTLPPHAAVKTFYLTATTITVFRPFFATHVVGERIENLLAQVRGPEIDIAIVMTSAHTIANTPTARQTSGKQTSGNRRL